MPGFLENHPTRKSTQLNSHSHGLKTTLTLTLSQKDQNRVSTVLSTKNGASRGESNTSNDKSIESANSYKFYHSSTRKPSTHCNNHSYYTRISLLKSYEGLGVIMAPQQICISRKLIRDKNKNPAVFEANENSFIFNTKVQNKKIKYKHFSSQNHTPTKNRLTRMSSQMLENSGNNEGIRLPQLSPIDHRIAFGAIEPWQTNKNQRYPTITKFQDDASEFEFRCTYMKD